MQRMQSLKDAALLGVLILLALTVRVAPIGDALDLGSANASILPSATQVEADPVAEKSVSARPDPLARPMILRSSGSRSEIREIKVGTERFVIVLEAEIPEVAAPAPSAVMPLPLTEQCSQQTLRVSC